MPLGALFDLEGNFNSGEENSKPSLKIKPYFLTWFYVDFLLITVVSIFQLAEHLESKYCYFMYAKAPIFKSK